MTRRCPRASLNSVGIRIYTGSLVPHVEGSVTSEHDRRRQKRIEAGSGVMEFADMRLALLKLASFKSSK